MRKIAAIASFVLVASTASAADERPAGMSDMEAELVEVGDDMAVRQEAKAKPRVRKAVNLSGPRIGVTYVLGEEARLLRDRLDVNPIMTQFGWQFEYRFFEQEGGFSGINEFIFLLGGLDQAAVLPSASWIIGVRSSGGIEVGAGPVLALTPMIASIRDGDFGLGNGKSLSGIGFAVAAGVTIRADRVNFPINLALVRSDTGFRLSLLAGFNLQDEDEDDELDEDMKKRVHQPETAAPHSPPATWLGAPQGLGNSSSQHTSSFTGRRPVKKASPIGNISGLEDAVGIRHATAQELVDRVRDSADALGALKEVEARKSDPSANELNPVYVVALAHEKREVSNAALRLMLKAPRLPSTTVRDLVADAIATTTSEKTAEYLYRYLVRWNPLGMENIQHRLANQDTVPASIRSHAEVAANLSVNN